MSKNDLFSFIKTLFLYINVIKKHIEQIKNISWEMKFINVEIVLLDYTKNGKV